MTQQDEVKQLRARLAELGPYRLKGSKAFGWYVVGRNGYVVGTTYSDTQIEALRVAIWSIEAAIEDKRWPGWRFGDEGVT